MLVTVLPPKEFDMLQKVFTLVCDHFNDVDKAKDWMQTLNPLFGGICPYQMVRIGRTKKLLSIVKYQISENEAPKCL